MANAPKKPYPPVHYADYLKLDKLLDAQKPRSTEFGAPAHDEMLFVIIHQVYELWFKQILVELDSILSLFGGATVDERNMGIAVSRLERITKIQALLVDQIRILETMTPLDFLEFRDFLSPASGFQSVQFRLLENKLGLPGDERLLFDKSSYKSRLSEAEQAQVSAAEKAPSLFAVVESWLERTPFLNFGNFEFWKSYQNAVKAMFIEDRAIIDANAALTPEARTAQLEQLTATEQSFEMLFDEIRHQSVQKLGQWRMSFRATHAALLIHLYRDQPVLHLPFKLLTLLVDMDELFTTWRQQHAHMVHRMIGRKIGTGGSSGAKYLQAAANKHKVFSDLANLSTFLIPRSALPKLPAAVEKSLGFAYQAK